MRPGIVFRSDAHRDIRDILSWYRKESPQLARRFVVEVDRAIRRLREGAQAFPRFEGDVRRVMLHRFPYGIYFTLDKSCAVVLAVLHLHRDPEILRHRLK